MYLHCTVVKRDTDTVCERLSRLLSRWLGPLGEGSGPLGEGSGPRGDGEGSGPLGEGEGGQDSGPLVLLSEMGQVLSERHLRCEFTVPKALHILVPQRK